MLGAERLSVFEQRSVQLQIPAHTEQLLFHWTRKEVERGNEMC